MTRRRTSILWLALLLDLLLGDPPNRFHPVAAMGSIFSAARQQAPRNSDRARLAYGAAVILVGAAGWAGVGWLAESLLERLPKAWSRLGEAALLKLTFSLSGLSNAAGQIQAALESDRLDEARRLVSWHLVSRDTSALDAGQVAAAAIESVAENASDGVIAPLLYYTLGGLPAALAYRFVSTGDSILGYRDEEREWLGKVPARLDDLVNLIPSRLTALLLIPAATLGGARAKDAWHYWRSDARKTASPNAGQPMSAMAGALNVQLEKVGHYRLGEDLPQPRPADVKRCLRLTLLAAALGAGLFSLATWLTGGRRTIA